MAFEISSSDLPNMQQYNKLWSGTIDVVCSHFVVWTHLFIWQEYSITGNKHPNSKSLGSYSKSC